MIHTVALADIQPQPWRNGGGSTQELLAWPASAQAADGWVLRISVARIERDGPFSAYPGIERWFAVVEGDGVTLHMPATTHALRPDSAPFHFDGALAPGCSLLHGATQDLNLMVRNHDGRGHMSLAMPGETWNSDAEFRAVFSTGAATLTAGNGHVSRMRAGTLAWSVDSAGHPWRLAPLDSPLGIHPRAWWMDVRSHESGH